MTNAHATTYVTEDARMYHMAQLYRKKCPVIARMNCREDFGFDNDPKGEFVLKNLYLTAEESPDGWELIAFIEIEACKIDGFGNDTGYIIDTNGGEVYRIPFPFDKNLRKRIVTLIRNQPRFWCA